MAEDKKKVRRASKKSTSKGDTASSCEMLDLQVRQCYLQGCILVVKKNGGMTSEAARQEVEAIGHSFQMSNSEIEDCYAGVSEVNASDEAEFVGEIIKCVKSAGVEQRFLFNAECCAFACGEMKSATHKLINQYAKPLGRDNTWRAQVLDSLKSDDDRKRWINCCRQISDKLKAHDAHYAMAYWHFNGIEVGLNDSTAENLYRQAAKQGNADAQKAVDAIDARRAEEERIRAEKEAKRRAAEERKRAKEEAAAKRRAEEKAAKNRAAIVEGLLGLARGVGCLLPIVLIGWLIWHWHSNKVERINSAANSILQNMVSIQGAKFKIGKTEVTQAQWYGIMGKNPSKHEGDNLPVENVSWNDCQEFLEELNKSDAVKKSQMKRFRLPTEHEWEYACRAGGTGDVGLMAGGKQGRIDEMAWYNCESTHPVATKKPNAYGLYDMHGNVFEWCSDVKKGLMIDDRVNKGGAFDKSAEQCSASYRDSDPPRMSFANTGLRVVCE